MRSKRSTPGAENDHRKKLVGPKAKRAAAQWSTERFGLSQRRACRLLALDRQTLGIGVVATRMRRCAPESARLPRPSGGMAAAGSISAYGARAGASIIRRWNGFILATRGCHYGDVGRRSAPRCRGSRSPDRRQDAVMRWISCMIGWSWDVGTNV